MTAASESKFSIVSMSSHSPQECPCGNARRAFIDEPNGVASLHLVDIQADSQVHYHKQTTELYYILEGEGDMELDQEIHPVKAGDAILIRPGCRHRAIGKLKLLDVPVPAFDPTDEWFD